MPRSTGRSALLEFADATGKMLMGAAVGIATQDFLFITVETIFG